MNSFWYLLYSKITRRMNACNLNLVFGSRRWQRRRRKQFFCVWGEALSLWCDRRGFCRSVEGSISDMLGRSCSLLRLLQVASWDRHRDFLLCRRLASCTLELMLVFRTFLRSSPRCKRRRACCRRRLCHRPWRRCQVGVLRIFLRDLLLLRYSLNLLRWSFWWVLSCYLEGFGRKRWSSFDCCRTLVYSILCLVSVLK